MMIKHQAIRTPRSPMLRRLALTTALAGTMTLLPAAARAQNNTPGGQTVVSPSGANAPTFNGGTGTLSGNATNLDVDLRAQSTIINWNRFNIAQGSRVNYETGLSGDVAVLNRVTGGGMTNIRGVLNSDSNISVFLVNPSGIMVSSTGSVSTGSFVASTLGISDSDFNAKRYIFAENYPNNSDPDIEVRGNITTNGTGIGLILLGRRIETSGTLNSGTQDTALVAADDVTLNYTAGSPLGIQITSGTDVQDAMRIVGGSVQGRNVYFAVATRSGLTNSLLQIDGNVRAVGGTKGIVIVGGDTAIDPDVTVSGASRGVDVTVNGSLAYESAAATGGIRLGGTGAVTVAGGVDSAGAFTVRGESVALGEAGATVLQRAAGAVSIVATDGDIEGLGTLTLAGAQGGGGEALVLDADDDILFRSATTIESGTTSADAALNLFSGRRSGTVQLGNVRARTLDGGISGGALEGALVRAQGTFGNGAVSAGTVTLGGSATIGATTLTLRNLTAAGPASLTGQTMAVGSVTSNGGAVTIDARTLAGFTAGTRTNITAAGGIVIDADVSAVLGAVRSGADVTVDAGALDVLSVDAVTNASFLTRNGNLDIGNLTVTAGAASIDAEDDVSVTGTVSVAGDYNVAGDAVLLDGVQSAAGAVTVAVRRDAIRSGNSLVLTANSDATGTEALTLRGAVDLAQGSTLNGGPARQSNVVVDAPIASDIVLGKINAAGLTIAGGSILLGNLSVGNVTTTSDLSLQSFRTIDAFGLRSTAGLVDVRADTIDVGAVQAATDARLSGRIVLFDSVNAATFTGTTNGPVGARHLDGGSITTSGLATLTSNAGYIEVDSITAGGLNISSGGLVTLGGSDITGAATIATAGSASDIAITRLDATGAVSVTGSRDIFAGRLASSGGALSVSAARDVRGTAGGNAALNAAGALVLTAGGNAQLGLVSGNTLRLEADALNAQRLRGDAGIDARATAGNLTLGAVTTVAGDATVSASGTARVNGPVSIGGNYSVAGADVILAGTQNATGTVDVTARTGSIGDDPGLVLTANSDGVGSEALTLHGRTDLADSLLRGGPGRQSQVVIDASASVDVRLGDVDAGSLAIAGGAALGGNLTFGTVNTSDAVTLDVAGGINGSALTSVNGAVTLSGAGSVNIGTLSGTAIDIGMQGQVDVDNFAATAGAARFVSRTGAVLLGSGSATGNVVGDARGLVSVSGAIDAGADYRIRGGAVALGIDGDAELQSAARTVDITATGGINGGTGLTLRSGTGALILDGAGGMDFGAGVLQAGSAGTGQLGLRAGNGQTIDLGDSVKVGSIGSVTAAHDAIGASLNHAGALRFGTLDAADAVAINLSGGDLNALALNGAGAVSIDVGTGVIDIGAVNAASLAVTGGAINGGTYRASGAVALNGGTITLAELNSTAGSVAATASAGTLSIDQVNAAVDLSLTTTGAGDVSVGNATADRNLALVARDGNIRSDSAAAGGTLTLTASGDITARTGANPALSGQDVVITVGRNLNTSSITSPGGLSVTAASISVGQASAGGALSLNAANGPLSVGTATATGAIAFTSAGDMALGSVQSGAGVTLDARGNLSLVEMTAPGAASIRAGGRAGLSSVQAGGLTVEAGSIGASDLRIGGTTVLTSTAGAVDVERVESSAVTLRGATDATVLGWVAPGGLTITAAGRASLGTGTSGTLTVRSGSIGIADAAVAGATDLSSSGAIAIGGLTSGDAAITAGGALTIDRLRTGGAVLQAASTQLGTANLNTLRITGGSAAVADATVAGTASVDVTGAVDIAVLRGADIALRGASIEADALAAAGGVNLTGTSGAVDLGQLNGGAVVLGAATNVAVDGWSTGTLALTAGGETVLGTGTSSGLTVRSASLRVADATVTGATVLEVAGAATLTRLSGSEVTVRAGSITADLLAVGGTTSLTSTAGAVDLGQMNGGAVTIGAATNALVDGWRTGALAITATGDTVLGSGTSNGLTVKSASLRIADATVAGSTAIDTSGAATVTRLSGGDLTMLAGGLATLGTVTSTGAATVRAGDVALDGQLRASTVTIGSRNADAGLRLGGAADVQGSGVALGEAELGRVDTDRLTLDGGTGDVTIGTLAFGASAGRTRVDVLSSGEILVNGVVAGDGAGRLFRLGGSAAAESDLASAIRIVATGTAGGRLLFGNADVELRGARIGLGLAGLTDALFAGGGISAEEAGVYIGNANSPLYSALAGGSAYVPGSETTLSAGRLTLRFDDFALFQNTGTRGFNTGAVLAGSPGGGPTLNLIGPGNGTPTAFAIFGTINGISGTSTAVLGQSVITTTGIDFAAARVNGCVLGTGAGCLTTTIAQPTLNVFDPGRLIVFRAEADFTLPFDPVIGSNNEALFAGVGAIAEPVPSAAEATPCAPGDDQCTPAQQDQE